MTSHAVWGLVATTFVAAFVEFVEALTIVLAMALTRAGARPWLVRGAALFALAGVHGRGRLRLASGCPARRCSSWSVCCC